MSSAVDISCSSAGSPMGIDLVGIVRAASVPDSSRFKVNHNSFIFGPRCIINGPCNGEAFFDRAEFALLAWCLFGLFPVSSVAG